MFVHFCERKATHTHTFISRSNDSGVNQLKSGSKKRHISYWMMALHLI